MIERQEHAQFEARQPTAMSDPPHDVLPTDCINCRSDQGLKTVGKSFGTADEWIVCILQQKYREDGHVATSLDPLRSGAVTISADTLQKV